MLLMSNRFNSGLAIPEKVSTHPKMLLLLILGVSLLIGGLIPLLDITWCVGIIIGIGGVGLLWIAYKVPHIFLLLALWTNFLKAIYIPGLAYDKYGITPFMAFTLIATLGYFLQIVLDGRKIVFPTGVIFLLIYFIGTTFTSLFVKDINIMLGRYAREVFEWLVFFCLIQMLSDRSKLRLLVSCLLIQAIVVMVWGIGTSLLINYAGVAKQEMLFWQQFQKNDYAVYLAFVFVLSLATQILPKTKASQKFLALFVIILTPLAWMFTYSRSGLVAMAASVVVFLFLDRSRRTAGKFTHWGPYVATLFFVVLIVFPSQARDFALDSIKSLLDPLNPQNEQLYTNVVNRLLLAESALEVVSKNPLLGIDYSQWDQIAPITTKVYDPQLGTSITVGQNIHNKYLFVGVKSGLVTLLAYLAFIGNLLLQVIRARLRVGLWLHTYTNAFIASMIGILAALMFLPSVLWEWPVLGILAGLLTLVASESPNYRMKNHVLKIV
jgi:hypothetical protein